MSTVNLKQASLNNSRDVVLSRRDKFYLRYAMYNDNYKNQVIRRLSEIYAKAVNMKLDKQMDLTNNIYKTIVNKISRVYSFGVSRQTEDKAIQDILESGIIDKTMKQANKYVNAFNDVLLQVGYNNKKDELKFNFRLPHKTEIKTDEFDEVIEVEYFVEELEEGYQKWAFWSDEEHYYKIYDNAREDFKVEYIEGNEKGLNPYGILPFVVMQNGFRDGYFWDEHTGDDLVYITLDNAIYNTFKNYMIKWQSFKQLVVTGKGVNGISGQVLDPATALTAEGEDVNISLLDFQANLEELGNTIDSTSNKVAVNYNISPNQFRMTGQVSSGFALKMENKELDEFTQEQQKDFMKYESELFTIIQKVLEVNGIKSTNDVVTEIEAPSYQESRDAVLSNYEKSISLGLNNPVSIIMNEKNIDEKEAIEIYNENIKYRNEVNNKLTQDALNLETTATALEQANA